MTPAQFLARVKRNDIAPAYLFLGTEAYQGRRAREALLQAMLGAEGRDSGLTRYDLAESSLAEVIDDARSLSLFAAQRVIVATNAEAALPRTPAAALDETEEGEAAGGSAEPLAAYLNDPSPGVVLLFEAARFDFEGDDKKKLERVRKFYAAIPDVVELRRPAASEARAEAEEIARARGLRLEPSALELLVEAVGADLNRIAMELEKMALFAGGGRPVTMDDVAALVPDARSTTIFALVAALGRRDRARSLQALDTLSREGEYLPLALAFLGTQFRMALAAREAGLRGPQQIQSYFARQGVPVWSARAEQIHQTVSKFSAEQMERAMRLIFAADKGLRDARPDDRIVMEQFVLELTG